MKETRGFDLKDVMIVASISMILLAIAVPTAGSLRDHNLVDEIVGSVEELESAAKRFRADTGCCANELSTSPDGRSYSRNCYHQLSMPQDIEGWNGPYLDEPLLQEDSPTRGPVYLMSDLSVAPAAGFLVEGGARFANREGQLIVFHGVSQYIAHMVDAKLDSNEVHGAWHRVGRVEWTQGGGGALSVMLWAEPEEEETRP